MTVHGQRRVRLSHLIAIGALAFAMLAPAPVAIAGSEPDPTG